MTTITVDTATHDDIGSLVASVAALFREDAGRHDSLRDLDWPAREGAAYYSALVDDEACLVALARDGGHVAGHLIGKLSGPGSMLTGRIAVLESMRVVPGLRRTGAGVHPSAWSAGGLPRERRGGKPGMNGDGQPDRSVVPANSLNKAAAAEAGEERERAKGNTGSETRPGRSAGLSVSSELSRVRQVARRDREARFTALLHHVTLGRLLLAYQEISPKAAPGVDGVTWDAYGQDLVANLRDLHERVQQGRYRASPSRRAYIPKADGRQRPLGIATLEDNIVQRAVVEVLNAIYEADFRGFSYGSRPGRGPHRALDALAAGITGRRVNWVLDADIRDFPGQLDRVWLGKFSPAPDRR